MPSYKTQKTPAVVKRVLKLVNDINNEMESSQKYYPVSNLGKIPKPETIEEKLNYENYKEYRGKMGIAREKSLMGAQGLEKQATLKQILMRMYKVGECEELTGNVTLDLIRKKIPHYRISLLNETNDDGHAFIIFSSEGRNLSADLEKLSFSQLEKVANDIYIADPLLNIVFQAKDTKQNLTFLNYLEVNNIRKNITNFEDGTSNFDVYNRHLRKLEVQANQIFKALKDIEFEAVIRDPFAEETKEQEQIVLPVKKPSS